MQDFFFGETNQTKDKICQLQLSDVNKLGKIVTPDFFYAQLNRLLLSQSICNYSDPLTIGSLGTATPTR